MLKKCLALLLLSTPALAYQGGSLRPHNHTASEGGQLSNPSIVNGLRVSSGAVVISGTGSSLTVDTVTFTNSQLSSATATNFSFSYATGTQVNGGSVISSSISIPAGGSIWFNGTAQTSAASTYDTRYSSHNASAGQTNSSTTGIVCIATVTLVTSGGPILAGGGYSLSNNSGGAGTGIGILLDGALFGSDTAVSWTSVSYAEGSVVNEKYWHEFTRVSKALSAGSHSVCAGVQVNSGIGTLVSSGAVGILDDNLWAIELK